MIGNLSPSIGFFAAVAITDLHVPCVTEWNQLVAPISNLVNSEGYEFIPNIETIASYDS